MERQQRVGSTLLTCAFRLLRKHPTKQGIVKFSVTCLSSKQREFLIRCSVKIYRRNKHFLLLGSSNSLKRWGLRGADNYTKIEVEHHFGVTR